MRNTLFDGLLLPLAVTMVAAGTHHHEVQIRQTPSPSVNTTVPSTVEDGIQTECKTCPYKLCTNVAAYEYGHETSLTCWTRGDKIVDTTTWFKTVDNCYVTEWDLIEGNYTDVLSYCGRVDPVYTTGPSETIYNTECNIIPEFVHEPEDHTKMYQPEVDLTLTCYTNDGDAVLGNTQWYKTLSNCYVPGEQIKSVGAGLDYCGPIPFMEAKMREPDPEPSSAAQPVPTLRSVPLIPAREESRRSDISKRWLYKTKIGYDYADCLDRPDSSSRSIERYEYDDDVTVQCAGYSENEEDNGQIYLFTIDFCWVNDTLTDPQLIDDEERSEDYPNCNKFVDTEV